MSSGSSAEVVGGGPIASILHPSKASDFKPAVREAIVVLPSSKREDGSENAVRIRKLNGGQAAVLLEGIPTFGVKADDKSKQLDDFWQTRAPGLISASAVEPEFCFGEQIEGRVHWEWLDLADQIALLNGVLALNGLIREFPNELGRFLPQ